MTKLRNRECRAHQWPLASDLFVSVYELLLAQLPIEQLLTGKMCLAKLRCWSY